jgi:hypothetical protein
VTLGDSGYIYNLIERLLYRAFDSYVLENADLEDMLKLAQTRAIQLIDCIRGLTAPIQSDFDSYQRYRQAALDCYKKVDPAYKSGY